MHTLAFSMRKQFVSTRRVSPRALALVLALLVSTWSVAVDLPLKFDPTRDAAADVAQALALASAEGKRVIVDVGGEWCTWCHIMDRFIAANDDVRALIDASYVWVKVNWSPQNENRALLSRWPKIQGYPHLFVLDANGKLLHSQNTAELEAGKSYDRGRFLAFVKRWAPVGAAATRT
jgi:thiol:disulfide interchange protein